MPEVQSPDLETAVTADAVGQIPENIRSDVKEALAKRELSPEVTDALIHTLKARFKLPENKKLRKTIDFNAVEKRLRDHPKALFSLNKLEETGGEPQVVGMDGQRYIFEDRSKESPSGRRNLNAYQSEAQAKEFGVDEQSEASYREMLKSGSFDHDSISRLKTPKNIRNDGRAMYGHHCPGYRDDVEVGDFDARASLPNIGWRASLRV